MCVVVAFLFGFANDCTNILSAAQTLEKVSISFLLDRVDSAKFEELKTVKLEEEEEEEQEAAALDLSISHASNSTSVLTTSKQGSTSSAQPSSPAYSGSDSESADLLAKRTLPGPARVLTVHSYAKGDASGSDNEQTSGKKASATASMNEQELAEV